MGSYVEPTSQDHSKNVLYTIKKSEYVGRYIVAARDIQPGEVIFTDQAACIGNNQLLKPSINNFPLFNAERSHNIDMPNIQIDT